MAAARWGPGSGTGRPEGERRGRAAAAGPSLAPQRWLPPGLPAARRRPWHGRRGGTACPQAGSSILTPPPPSSRRPASGGGGGGRRRRGVRRMKGLGGRPLSALRCRAGPGRAVPCRADADCLSVAFLPACPPPPLRRSPCPAP